MVYSLLNNFDHCKTKAKNATTQYESAQHTETLVRDGTSQTLVWRSAGMASSLIIMDYYDHNKHY